MYWKDHNRWAAKIGISQEVSNYINNIIDVKDGREFLPQEYQDFVELESQKEANSKKKIVYRCVEDIVLEHDSARKGKNKTKREIAAKIQLNFLKNKGEDYVKTWYLHHALDYVADTEEWRNNTAETVEECINKHLKNKPETYSPEVMSFLMNNIQDLKKELKIN